MTLDDISGGVVLSPPDGSESQLWTFGITFRDGYFTLRNPKSGGYLTATSETSTTAEGIITSDKILSNIYLKRNWPSSSWTFYILKEKLSLTIKK